MVWEVFGCFVVVLYELVDWLWDNVEDVYGKGIVGVWDLSDVGYC